MNKYLQNLLIVFFALAVVLLGAKEFQKRYALYGHQTPTNASMMKIMKGTDVRASISRRAVRDSSEDEAAGKSLLSSFFNVTKKAAAERKSDDDNLDKLSDKDRHELKNLLDKVGK